MVQRFLARASVFVFAMTVSAASLLAQPGGQAPSGQDGFVPISSLPPSQQLPAAPYLVGAYAFIWVGALVYLWTIWRRLGKVEQDMQALQQRRK